MPAAGLGRLECRLRRAGVFVTNATATGRRGRLRLVLGDQVSAGLAGLGDLDPAIDLVLMAEVRDEATYVRHHKQ